MFSSQRAPRETGTEDGSGFAAEQAREFEQELLNEYSWLDADDVVIRQEGDSLVPEFTERGRNKRRRRARGRFRDAVIAENSFLNEEDFRVGSEDGSFTVEFTDEFVSDRQDARAESVDNIPGVGDQFAQDRDEFSSVEADFNAYLDSLPGAGGNEQFAQDRDEFGGDGIDLDSGTERANIPGLSDAFASDREATESNDRGERFGDVVIENPFTGNTVEEDLGSVSGVFDEAAESQIENSFEYQALGAAAQARDSTLSAAGFDDAAQWSSDLGGDDGSLEQRVYSEMGQGIVSVANLGDRASDAKEIGEFAYTQPSRLFDVGPGFTLVPEQEGQQEFAEDAGARGGEIFSTAQEGFTEDPIGYTSQSAGELLGGFAAGSAAGRVTGSSDLTGEIAQGTSRRVRNYLDDGDLDRAQLEIGSSTGRTSGGSSSDSVTLDSSTLSGARERSNPYGGRFGGGGPSRTRGNPRPDDGRFTEDRSTSGNGGSFSLGYRSPNTELGNRFGDVPTDDLRDLIDIERQLADELGDGVGSDAAVFGGTVGLSDATQSGELIDSDGNVRSSSTTQEGEEYELFDTSSVETGAFGLSDSRTGFDLDSGFGNVFNTPEDTDLFGDTDTSIRTDVAADSDTDTQLRYTGLTTTATQQDSDSRFRFDFDGRRGRRSNFDGSRGSGRSDGGLFGSAASDSTLFDSGIADVDDLTGESSNDDFRLF
ncbi:hypothetical protein [Haloprofundus marisrubri]|nr:hypothetical protein [Haloprofundus marisrubri]